MSALARATRGRVAGAPALARATGGRIDVAGAAPAPVAIVPAYVGAVVVVREVQVVVISAEESC